MCLYNKNVNDVFVNINKIQVLRSELEYCGLFIVLGGSIFMDFVDYLYSQINAPPP